MPGGERPRRAVPDLPLLPVGVVPLGLGRREARRVFLSAELAEEDLARREHRQALVAEHAEVELAPFDVLLDERVALEALVEKARALERLGLVLGERGLRDPVARLLADGLHEGRDRRSLPSRRSGRSRDETTKRATRMRW